MDLAETLNQARDGWTRATDLHFVTATADEVVVEWEVGPQHLQAYGLVHGGVFAGAIETIASVGAALAAMAEGRAVVGLENHTSFLHAVRGGRLRARAVPLVRGRRSHVWEGTVTDASGRAVAVGRVRLLCLETGAQVAGDDLTVKV